MRKKVSLGLVAVACLAFLTTGAMGQGNVFFSDAGVGPVPGDIVVSIDATDIGGSGILDIWSTDNQNFGTAISIDVASSAPGVIGFTDAVVSQPEMFSELLGSNVEIWRWQYTEQGDTVINPDAGWSVGSVEPDAIIGMNGAKDTTGEGVRSDLDGTVTLLKLLDPLYDQAAGAIMLGTIAYDVFALGTTTVSMSIGENLFVDGGEEITPTMWSAEITVSSGQDYTFGDWARDEGYYPGFRMPDPVWADEAGIDSLDGIGDFNWTARPTRRLFLSNNQLSSIESGDFSELTNLAFLTLENNQLSSIESGGFSGLTNLTRLDLRENQLSSIESGDFSELTNLTRLELQSNQLSSIESDDFSGLTNLEELQLGGNQISGIESGDFSGLTNLAELSLSANQITSIEAGTFSGLTNLAELSLSANQITSIEAGTFSGLTNLAHLELYNNQILSIESDDFSGLPNLTGLDLNGNQLSSIEAGALSGLMNLTGLYLGSNQLSSIESGAFSGLTNLRHLTLADNQISNIESGAFSGLVNLRTLGLGWNIALTKLNLADADFSSLNRFNVAGSASISSVSLRRIVVNETSLAALLDGGGPSGGPGARIGIGELDGITDMDLSGIDFVDITDLSPLYVMDDLTDLWFVDTQNVDATALDALLDNLETIESPDTEGVLYMTQADFDAFNAAGGGLLSDWNDEDGHHVEFLQIGDVNHDTEVNGLDVDPFVDVLLASRFDVAADMNGDGAVDGLDVEPFVAAAVGSAHQIPEPSTLLLALVTLGVIGGWRKWAA